MKVGRIGWFPPPLAKKGFSYFWDSYRRGREDGVEDFGGIIKATGLEKERFLIILLSMSEISLPILL